MDPGLSQTLCNAIGQRAQQGARYTDRSIVENVLQHSYVLVLREAQSFKPEQFAIYYRIYGVDAELRILQAVYPDEQGRHPWNDGFDSEAYAGQWLLFANTAIPYS